MPNLVESAYACSLMGGTKLPEGCSLQPDCSCKFADGQIVPMSQWNSVFNAIPEYIFTLGGIVVLAIILWLLKRKFFR